MGSGRAAPRRDVTEPMDGGGDASFLPLCDIRDLLEGEARGFDPGRQGETSVFAIRKDGTVRVYRDVCPHYGRTSLAWKRHAYLTPDAAHIICSAHGALFRPDDGLCVAGPCLGQHLAPVPTVVRDGVLHVRWPMRD